MAWTWSEDPDEYDGAAGPLLALSPVEHTISLTVLDNARAGSGPGGQQPTRFGWWTGQAGAATGAVSHTPPYPLLIAAVPDEAVRPLVDDLLTSQAEWGRTIAGVNGPTAVAAQLAAVWRAATGQGAMLGDALRLFRLDRLVPVRPGPRGQPRRAEATDRDLVAGWVRAFAGETSGMPDPEGHADALLGRQGAWLWEDPPGRPVALAGRQRPVAGVVRIGPVFTPVELRGLGYGGAATVAVTRDALELGARDVVLFTDLANPASNALYQRLGYRPVTDRLDLRFVPADNLRI